MDTYFALKCLKCAGSFQLKDGTTDFVCPYCGSPHLINPGNKTVSLIQMEESIQNAAQGVDKSAAELAIHRLEREIEDLLEERKNIPLYNDPGFGGFVWVMAIGVGLVFMGIGDFISNKLDYISIFIILLGGVSVFASIAISKHNRRVSKDKWEKESGQIIKTIDSRIEQKKNDVKYYQGLASNS